jgi:hypothetical protein
MAAAVAIAVVAFRDDITAGGGGTDARRATPRVHHVARRSAAAWPLAARAEQSGRMRRIGILMANAEDDPESKAQLVGFRQGLQQLGWPVMKDPSLSCSLI